VQPLTISCGRRGFASALVHDGRSVVEVAGQLGHSSATTTLKYYAHMVEDARSGERVTLAESVAELRRTATPTPSAGVLVATQTRNEQVVQ